MSVVVKMCLISCVKPFQTFITHFAYIVTFQFICHCKTPDAYFDFGKKGKLIFLFHIS